MSRVEVIIKMWVIGINDGYEDNEVHACLKSGEGAALIALSKPIS